MMIPRAVHLTGACGSGMRALGEFLIDQGTLVTASDEKWESHNGRSLQSLGVSFAPRGENRKQIAEADLLIHSAAISDDHPERILAKRVGTASCSYADFLGRLSEGQKTVCVIGTHGKTTTSALIAWILREAGFDPSLICGGETLRTKRHGWAGEGDLLVLESCEYRRHFLQAHPSVLVLLNVEWDHVDCFRSPDEMLDAYSAMLGRLPSDGLLIANGSCPGVQRVLSRGNRSSFPSLLEVKVQDLPKQPPAVAGLLGAFNQVNMVMASATCRALGLEEEVLVAARRTFPGLRRRLQWLGSWRGMSLYDDYAHHPTAVREVLRAVRNEEPVSGRLRVVFQPHQLSRTAAFLEEFAQSLALADEVLLMPVFSVREQPGEEQEMSHRLLSMIKAQGVAGELLSSLDHIQPTLETDARPGDKVILMGAGDIERIADDFSRRLLRYHAS